MSMSSVDTDVTNLFYVTMQVDSVDQAHCLAEYLNERGQIAYVDGGDAVVTAVHGGAELDALSALRAGWRRYWDTGQGELFGMPLYVKSDCDAAPR